MLVYALGGREQEMTRYWLSMFIMSYDHPSLVGYYFISFPQTLRPSILWTCRKAMQWFLCGISYNHGIHVGSCKANLLGWLA